MINIKAVEKQTAFCEELMTRLASDIRRDKAKDDYYGIYTYTQKKADIVRLRRELNVLNAMIYPYN